MDEIDFAEVVGRPVRAVDEWVPARGGQGSDVWRVQTDQGPVIVRRPREVPPGRGPFMITLHRLFGITPWDVASVAAVHAAMAPLAPVPAVLRCRPPFLVVQHLPGTPPRRFAGLGGLLGDRLGRIHARSFPEWGHPAGPPRHPLATFHARLAGVVPPSALRGLPPPPEATYSMGDIDAPTSGLPCGSMLLTCNLDAFTFLTCSTWSSMLRFLWMTPTPPSRAISRASLDSVTVSIGDETKGSSRVMFLVRCVASEISRGSTSLLPGTRMKSRKVNTLEAFFSFETKLRGGKVCCPCQNKHSKVLL